MGLKAADDSIVWEYAKANRFVLVSKDSDFHQRSLVPGHPPKAVWVWLGNCSTADVEALLRHYEQTINALKDDLEVSFLSLSW